MNNSPIKIDITQIPPVELKLLCQTLVKTVEQFYSDPKNRERFEQWEKLHRGGKVVLAK